MNMKKWLEDTRKAERKKAMPILSFPCITLMDVTVKQLISDSSLQAEGMRRIAQREDSLAVVSMMDLSLEAEAFGSETRFSDGEVPTVVGAIVTSEEDARALAVPKVGDGRTSLYLDAIGKVCMEVTDRPVFAGVIGPFSLTGRLMDVSEALANCIDEPDMVHLTMEKATAFLIDYISAYKKTGANGVVMAEPLTGILSPGLAEEFSEPYVKQIVDAVQDETFLVLYHNCGNNTIYMIDSILRTGCSAYHFGNSIDMKEMLDHIPDDVIVMGNVDPAGQFRNGTPESIYENTKKIMEECCPGHPNFIISSGCDIPPLSPWENIDAFFKAVKEYYA